MNFFIPSHVHYLFIYNMYLFILFVFYLFCYILFILYETFIRISQNFHNNIVAEVVQNT